MANRDQIMWNADPLVDELTREPRIDDDVVGVDWGSVGKDAMGVNHMIGTTILNAIGMHSVAQSMENLETKQGVLPDWAAKTLKVDGSSYIAMQPTGQSAQPVFLGPSSTVTVFGGKRFDGPGYVPGTPPSAGMYTVGVDSPIRIVVTAAATGKNVGAQVKRTTFQNIGTILFLGGNVSGNLDTRGAPPSMQVGTGLAANLGGIAGSAINGAFLGKQQAKPAAGAAAVTPSTASTAMSAASAIMTKKSTGAPTTTAVKSTKAPPPLVAQPSMPDYNANLQPDASETASANNYNTNLQPDPSDSSTDYNANLQPDSSDDDVSGDLMTTDRNKDEEDLLGESGSQFAIDLFSGGAGHLATLYHPGRGTRFGAFGANTGTFSPVDNSALLTHTAAQNAAAASLNQQRLAMMATPLQVPTVTPITSSFSRSNTQTRQNMGINFDPSSSSPLPLSDPSIDPNSTDPSSPTDSDADAVLGELAAMNIIGKGSRAMSAHRRKSHHRATKIHGSENGGSDYMLGTEILGSVAPAKPQRVQPRAGFVVKKTAGGNQILSLQTTNTKIGDHKTTIANAVDVGNRAIKIAQQLTAAVKAGAAKHATVPSHVLGDVEQLMDENLYDDDLVGHVEEMLDENLFDDDVLGAAARPAVHTIQRAIKATVKGSIKLTPAQIKKLADATMKAGKDLLSYTKTYAALVDKNQQKQAAGMAKAKASLNKAAFQAAVVAKVNPGLIHPGAAPAAHPAIAAALAHPALATTSAARSALAPHVISGDDLDSGDGLAYEDGYEQIIGAYDAEICGYQLVEDGLDDEIAVLGATLVGLGHYDIIGFSTDATGNIVDAAGMQTGMSTAQGYATDAAGNIVDASNGSIIMPSDGAGTGAATTDQYGNPISSTTDGSTTVSNMTDANGNPIDPKLIASDPQAAAIAAIGPMPTVAPTPPYQPDPNGGNPLGSGGMLGDGVTPYSGSSDNSPWNDGTFYSAGMLPMGAILFPGAPDLTSSSSASIGSANRFSNDKNNPSPIMSNPAIRSNVSHGGTSGYQLNKDGWQTYHHDSQGNGYSAPSGSEMADISAASNKAGYGPIIGRPADAKNKNGDAFVGLRYITGLNSTDYAAALNPPAGTVAAVAPTTVSGANAHVSGNNSAQLFWYFDTAPQALRQQVTIPLLNQAQATWKTLLASTMADQAAQAAQDQLNAEAAAQQQAQLSLSDAAQADSINQEQAQATADAAAQDTMDQQSLGTQQQLEDSRAQREYDYESKMADKQAAMDQQQAQDAEAAYEQQLQYLADHPDQAQYAAPVASPGEDDGSDDGSSGGYDDGSGNATTGDPDTDEMYAETGGSYDPDADAAAQMDAED